MTDFVDRVHGCLVGAAIGDALGATVENWSYDQVQDEYGKVETFRSYDNPHAEGAPGTVTDDSVMRHYLCLSIVENGGRVTPDEVADTLLDYLNPERVWITEEIAIRKLAAGMNPWDAGRNNVPAGTATMAMAPIGIINAGDPRQAYQDGFNIASINQDSVERDAAATVAAAVAMAVAPAATIDDVLSTMQAHSTKVVFRSIDLALGLADGSESVEEFAEAFYDELLDWTWPAVEWDRDQHYAGQTFSASSIESLPAAVGILSLCGEDPNQAIVEAASLGRDSDTIATLVGGIVGALHGSGCLRDTWKQQCERANENFFQEVHGDTDQGFEPMAHRLIDALEQERQRAEDRANYLDDLIGSPP